jgi:arylsulfatase A-like enzyme
VRKLVSLLGILLVLGSHACARAAADRPARPKVQPPNILLINTDDQRADTLDVMPKLRHWFASGRGFPRAQVNIPSCCPSRATLLSGRYTHNNGVRRQEEAALLNMEATLPAVLWRAGYATAMAGKFLNSWPLTAPPPFFDSYAAIHGGYDSFNVFQGDTTMGGRFHRLHRDATNPTLYSTGWLAEQLGANLDAVHRRDPAKPWFAYYAPYAPHPPATPDRPFAEQPMRGCLSPDETDRTDKPGYVKRSVYQASEYARLCADQLRTLISVDNAVDGLLRRINGYGPGVLDRTLVIFTSDNGYLWGEHGRTEKFAPYLPSVRVPLLMRWPAGHVTAGVDRRLASTVDIMPTVLEAAGIPVDADAPPLDGRSLLRPVAADHDVVYSEYWEDRINSWIPTWAASYDGRLHYVEYFDVNEQLTFRELYDVARDPTEDVNLALRDDMRTTVALLHRRLVAFRNCKGTTCHPGAHSPGPHTSGSAPPSPSAHPTPGLPPAG